MSSVTSPVRSEDALIVEPVPSSGRSDLPRFVWSAAISLLVVSLPVLWVQFVLWNGTPDLLRNVYQNGYGGGFYDLQTRAILSGHLWVPKGSLALEAWVHNGRDYTYFGVFPSLLRLPVFLVTHSLDGKLSALSLLAAWVVTGLVTSMLVWRVRIILRGGEALGRAEAIGLGATIASVAGGSVLVYLAANPYVYSEDKAWSVALCLGGFYALLGMLERPSWGRVITSGVFIVCANLTRVAEGYACVIGALLVAAWFALGRRGRDNRRWCLPMVGVAVVAVGLGCAVTWAKFGVLFGLPTNDYVAFHALGEQHINGGRYFDLAYLPSTLVAYLQPGGLRLTSVFPYLTLPAGPPRALAGVMFDNRTRTASVPASMPLLFGLSLLGLVAAFRRHVADDLRMFRPLLVAAAAGTAAVLLYGWIANRYLADFLPFLILAGSLGVVSLWHWLRSSTRNVRTGAAVVIALLALFSVLANIALSITPSDAYTPAQASAFLRVQRDLSNVTGHPLAGHILRGNRLPYWAPAGTIFVADDCSALYVSNGEDYTGVLDQRAEHRTWVVAAEGPGYRHAFRVTLGTPTAASGTGQPLATVGRSTVSIHTGPANRGYVAVAFSLQDPRFPTTSVVTEVKRGSENVIELGIDRFTGVVELTLNDTTLLAGPITVPQGASVAFSPAVEQGPIQLRPIPSGASNMSFCRSISGGA